MRVEMVEKESVRDFVSLMTEKFLDKGNEIKKFPEEGNLEIFKIFEGWMTPKVRKVKPPWTEDIRYSDGHRKHPFEVLCEKESRLDLEIKYLNWDMENERIELFKHENPDWRENHMEVVWEMESERDSHLI